MSKERTKSSALRCSNITNSLVYEVRQVLDTGYSKVYCKTVSYNTVKPVYPRSSRATCELFDNISQRHSLFPQQAAPGDGTNFSVSVPLITFPKSAIFASSRSPKCFGTPTSPHQSVFAVYGLGGWTIHAIWAIERSLSVLVRRSVAGCRQMSPRRRLRRNSWKPFHGNLYTVSEVGLLDTNVCGGMTAHCTGIVLLVQLFTNSAA